MIALVKANSYRIVTLPPNSIEPSILGSSLKVCPYFCFDGWWNADNSNNVFQSHSILDACHCGSIDAACWLGPPQPAIKQGRPQQGDQTELQQQPLFHGIPINSVILAEKMAQIKREIGQ